MIRTLLAALLCSAATHAAALSCVPHDPAAVFQRIHAAPDRYIAALGSLTFDANALPQVDWENQAATPSETRLPARLTGHSLTRDGFNRPFDSAITLIVGCAGPWCAAPQSGSKQAAFLRATNGEYSLYIGPCGGDAFGDPTRTTTRTIEQCFNGETCTPKHART